MKNKTSFSRLPGNVINNELYVVQKNLQAFLSSQTNGDDVNNFFKQNKEKKIITTKSLTDFCDDVNVKNLNQIIKDLQNIKKEIKHFDDVNDVPVKYSYTAV